MLELPTELWLEIIELLKPWDEGTPITGKNAAWVKLNVARPPRVDLDAESYVDNEAEPWSTARTLRTKETDAHCVLWDLRATCKAMNKLCAPYLFNTINFLKQDPDPSTDLPIRYARHVRSLRILVDPYLLDATRDEEYQANIAALIKLCFNVTSIAVYYRRQNSDAVVLLSPITDLVKTGVLKSFGIYSILVLHQDVGEPSWNRIRPKTPVASLSSYWLFPEGTNELRKLDVVVETIEREAYNLIRRHFCRLESLTFRRGITSGQGRIGSPYEITLWKPKPHLTHLRLIDCAAGYAPHIPSLIGLFPSLLYLLISTCGDEDDSIPPPRQPQWSLKEDALCNTHAPLQEFHIEHMEVWEILALGTIPAKRVILSSIPKGHFIAALAADPEIFPHLESLSLLKQAWDPTGEDAKNYRGDELQSMKEQLLTLCRQRRIEVRADGYRIKGSSDTYGFA